VLFNYLSGKTYTLKYKITINMTATNNVFVTFYDTILTLRGHNGCPWDKKQTTQSLKKYFREESNELIDAIDSGNPEHICEEAGDVLFLLALLAQIHNEKNEFNLDDILSGITKKMVRRHPHVFANAPVGSEEELNAQWEKIKSEEQSKKTN
jgi:tetrapyrrole methylase family protein/MazG family protein